MQGNKKLAMAVHLGAFVDDNEALRLDKGRSIVTS